VSRAVSFHILSIEKDCEEEFEHHELLFTNVDRLAKTQRQLQQKETALEAEKEELKNANWN
jgi:hypothetical protein